MTKEDLSIRLEAAKAAARLAGALLAKGPAEGLKTKVKGKNDFVTEMDVKSEHLIKEYLHARFPEDNFLGEEMGFQQYGNQGTWIIDPIDGTTNYIHGLPGYTISIAFEVQRWQPVLGVVYDPLLDEMYSAQEKEGAWMEDQRISVSDVSDPHETVMLISPPLRKRERMDTYLEMFKKLCADSGEMRDYGSAALHLSYVAHGRAEAFIEFNLGYHDIAAGVVILKEAGGVIAPLDTSDVKAWHSNIIATNAQLHDWFVSRVQLN